jgi:hypothetical protein
MFSENAHGCVQSGENGFGFDSLERYLKDGDEFLNHIVRVTGNEPWVSFVNVETKEQSKQWMHIHQASRKSSNKLCLCQKTVGISFLDRKGVLLVEFVQQGTTIKSEVCCEIQKKKKCVEPFRTKGFEC